MVDHSSESWGNVYNFFGVLREHSDMSEKEINELSEKFKAGRTDAMLVNLDKENYYLVYEKSDIQDWMFLGLVREDIVNASMNSLQRSTMLLVSVVVLCIAALLISFIIQKSRASLRRKDTEILYRDELFQKLSMNVDDVFLMLDAKTYQADYVSPNVEKLMGFTVEQIRKDIYILGKLHPWDSENSKKNYLEGIQTSEQQEWDFEYVHQKTGERRWFHIVAMGSEVNRKKKYILVMSDRTSDRNMNQALSEAVRAAETANKAKSTFLSNMSHDIRTPMNAIIGFTTLAVSNIDDKERVRDYLGKILSSSNHLLSLINDILDMARIDSGKIILVNEKMLLPEVIESAINIIYPLVRAKKQEFSVRLHNVAHESLKGDELKVSQILINILTNAVKFTQEGGSITVDVEELKQPDEKKAVFQIAIADNGIGIKPEFLNHIFTAFVREQDSKVNKIEGSGLGMAITKRIVDLMNGQIQVESQEGKGSTFRVKLPFDLWEDEETVHPIRCQSVLLVGDSETQGMETARTLMKAGVNSAWVADAQTAVSRITDSGEGFFQAVLIDRDIFNHGQAEKVCKACGEQTKLALAAYDWDDIRSEAEQMGISYFIQKPLFRSVLQASLNAMLDHECLMETTEPGSFDFSGRTILLAEDNDLNREIICNILLETGADIVCTKDGAECVETFADQPEGRFDQILIDIQMPVMNGYDAAKKIRSLDRTDSNIPIFAMSANAYAEDMEQAQAAGMTGYLTKPINLEIWLKEIRTGMG